jgi:4'-phosphopantetheinyl transferase
MTSRLESGNEIAGDEPCGGDSLVPGRVVGDPAVDGSLVGKAIGARGGGRPGPLEVLQPAALLALTHPLTLEPDTLHVWAFDLEGSPALLELCRSCLSSEERRRADRFVFARDRGHHTVAHGVLRHLLGRYCSVAPESLQFSVTAAGKPSLQSPAGHAAGIHFNLTHSGGRALLGVSQGRELGIDLEQVRSNIEALSISRNYFFGSERDAIEQALSATRDNTFFRYWVAKEAVLKAQGIGLGFPLDQFRIDFLPGGDVARIETFDLSKLDGAWTIRMLPCDEGWLAAVAARGDDWAVKVERPVVTDPPHL